MKKTKYIATFLGAAPLLMGLSIGQEVDVVIEEESTDAVSGWMNMAWNSHFISYGADVWGGGTGWDDDTFNPSIGLDFDLGSGFTASLGLWMDVNNYAPTSIGHSVQEVDVWAGIGYATGDWSFSLTYQEWMYGGDSERIVDLGIGYALSVGEIALDPSVTVHNRINDFGGGGEEGTVVVVGVSPGTDLGPVSLSVPINVGFALTDDYFTAGGDTGFAYASIGLSGSYPLDFISIGDWSLDAGITLYTTSDDVYANPDDTFVTGMLGTTLSF